jgi:hypothetical protein
MQAILIVMGRVIAAGPGGKSQAPERDDRCRPVIEYVVTRGLLGRKLLSPASLQLTLDDAAGLKRAMFRSARYYCSCDRWWCTRKFGNIPGRDRPAGGCPAGGKRVSCSADVVRDAEGRYRVQFQLFDKTESIREVVRRYGPDPNLWPYFSKRKRPRE